MLYQKRQRVVEKYYIEAQRFIVTFNFQKESFDGKDYLILKHSDMLKDKRTHHSAAMTKKHKKLQALQKLVLDLKNVMRAEKTEATTLAEKVQLGTEEPAKII